MRSTTSVLTKLQQDLPEITFSPGETFHWSPESRTVYYSDPADTASLLHEVAHALLGHAGYSRDIELLKMERDAWNLAVDTLSVKYEVAVDQDLAEDMLDTYRNWLHARSTCPKCEATGLQSAANLYSCLVCKGSWRVNEARSCALRRYQAS